MKELTMLLRLADRERFSVRLTYRPKTESHGEVAPSEWGLTIKPLSGSPLSFREPRRSDHIHYDGRTLRDAVEDALLHHYEHFVAMGGRS